MLGRFVRQDASQLLFSTGIDTSIPATIVNAFRRETTDVRLLPTATPAQSVTPSCEHKQAPVARQGQMKKEEWRACISSRFSTNGVGAPPT